MMTTPVLIKCRGIITPLNHTGEWGDPTKEVALKKAVKLDTREYRHIYIHGFPYKSTDRASGVINNIEARTEVGRYTKNTGALPSNGARGAAAFWCGMTPTRGP